MNAWTRCAAVALALLAAEGVTGCSGSTAQPAAAPASGAAATTASAAPSTSAPARRLDPSPTLTGRPAATRPVHLRPSASASAVPAGGTGGAGADDATNCVNAMLSVVPSTSGGAAGTMVQRFLLTNVSSADCSMQGRPVVTPYGPKGSPGFTMSVDAIPSGFGELGQKGGTIVLKPGQSAVFFLKWSDVPVGDAACPKAVGFAFRAPVDPLADSDKLVPFAFQPCGSGIEVSDVLPTTVTV